MNTPDQQMLNLLKLAVRYMDHPDVQEIPFALSAKIVASRMHAAIERYELNKSLDQPSPYPWCKGNPTKLDCAQRGYCSKDPNCGE